MSYGTNAEISGILKLEHFFLSSAILLLWKQLG